MTDKPETNDAFVNAVHEAGRIFVEELRGEQSDKTRILIGHTLEIDTQRWADERGLANAAVAFHEIKAEAKRVLDEHFASLGH